MQAILVNIKLGVFQAFEAPQDELLPGDVLEFTTWSITAAGHSFSPGDTIRLMKRTNLAPFGTLCSLGNWQVQTKFDDVGDVTKDESIWSNIELAIVQGRLAKKTNLTIPEQANAHMEARWKYLGKKSWRGRVTKGIYFASNRRTVEANIRNGRVPNGKGFYKS